MPLWLLGIGIGPKANQLRRQLGLAGHRGVVEQSLAARAQKPCARSIAFDRGEKSVSRRCPQDGVEGCIRSERPGHSGIGFDHGLQMSKASLFVPIGRVDVEIAMREQELDPFEGLDPLGPATVAPIHTAQRIERLGEGMAHEFRVGKQCSRDKVVS